MKKLTSELIIEISKRAILNQKLIEAQQELSFMRKWRVGDKEQLNAQRDEINRLKDLIAELNTPRPCEYLDMSGYSTNAFEWSLNDTTAEWIAMMFLTDGHHSEAALEMMGLELLGYK